MFLNQKMASRALKYSIVIVVSGIIAIAVLCGLGLGIACPVNQVGILNDLKKYDQAKDPELCAQINDKISQFDNKCGSSFETLDCG